MPEKPLTIATYAAGASLAAITLVYVFGPTYFLDDDATTKKKGVVGLTNAANDCFINSVLQALAGLPDLRIYLIRETHRRLLDGPDVYHVDPERQNTANGPARPAKLEGLQRGVLTHGLKDILDALNERPIYKKTISPQPFIRTLERAFGTRISRQQQDAQEFLQIVTERLCDEYHAGGKARRRATLDAIPVNNADGASGADNADVQSPVALPEPSAGGQGEDPAEEDVSEEEEGFPFEGKIESQIECQSCHFKPKPTVSTFVTLTLNVPQASSTSLNACLDGMLKVEYIDDFRCERCRLEHALQSKNRQLLAATDPSVRERLQSDIAKIQLSIDHDPEQTPDDVELPPSSQAPKSRIARHMYISQFPKVLAIHLSRSTFAFGATSMKNMAKVAFPEALPLGELLNRKNYRLLAMVTHKGSHNSGHYESFRRQVQRQPFSTPVSFGTEGAFSRQASPFPSAAPSVAPSAMQSPHISALNLPNHIDRRSPLPDSPMSQSLSSQETIPLPRGPPPTSAPRVADSEPSQSGSSSTGVANGGASGEETLSRSRSIRSLKERTSEKASSIADVNPMRRKSKKANHRWWRISDDKVKESKTSEVLNMQKDVYLYP
ncbi:hypothetical protein ACJQWK_04622 [Exserohilum turcicum]